MLTITLQRHGKSTATSISGVCQVFAVPAGMFAYPRYNIIHHAAHHPLADSAADFVAGDD